MLNGVTNLFSREMRTLVKPVYQRFFHNLMALVTFVLGMSALYYGFEKRTIREYASEEIRWILKIFLCITIVTSSIAALKSGYQQFKDVVGTTRESILPEKSWKFCRFRLWKFIVRKQTVCVVWINKILRDWMQSLESCANVHLYSKRYFFYRVHSTVNTTFLLIQLHFCA